MIEFAIAMGILVLYIVGRIIFGVVAAFIRSAQISHERGEDDETSDNNT